jgi:uncharacterized protein YidB (DUF937 family)
MANDGFPSMTALLGLLAIAGYQNRDKLAELLGGAGRGNPAPGTAPASPPPGMNPGASQPGGLGGLLGGLAGQDPGSFLGSGLNNLLQRFTQAGHGDVAQSWVGTGPNQPVAPQQLEQAIGSDTLSALSRQTGLSRDELLARLSRELPSAVDRYTPEGRLPGLG